MYFGMHRMFPSSQLICQDKQEDWRILQHQHVDVSAAGEVNLA